MRHVEKQNCLTIRADSDVPDVHLTEHGEMDAMDWGARLPCPIDLIISTSPTARTIETGNAIFQGRGLNKEVQILIMTRQNGHKDIIKWESLKKEMGWSKLISSWIEGNIPEHVISSHRIIAEDLLVNISAQIKKCGGKKTIVVTHDHIISILASYFFNRTTLDVGYMNGFCIPYQYDPDELLKFQMEEGEC